MDKKLKECFKVMGYVDEVLDIVSKKNADQPEFLQAVTEVLESLRPVVEANEEVYLTKAMGKLGDELSGRTRNAD